MPNLPAANTSTSWGRFELSREDARRFFHRQLAWAAAQTLLTVGFAALPALGLPSPPVAAAIGLATGLGAAATRPTRAHLLPLLVAVVVGVTLLLVYFGVPAAVAAGAAAGFSVARGGALARFEAVLAGLAGAALGAAFASTLGMPTGSLPAALLNGLAMGLLTAYSLLPGAIRFQGRQRIPSPSRIRATLAEPYRAPCMRASQLDQELLIAAPDPDTREGLAEVASWVYRLSVTLQTLDADVQRIDPVDVAARRSALTAEECADPFVRERRQSTVRHLGLILEHRQALLAERLRAAALQEYAVAWLEDARARLALSQIRPGEETPERLDEVLEKLRHHAADRAAHRLTAQELSGGP